MERHFQNLDDITFFVEEWSKGKKLYIFGAGAYGRTIGAFLNQKEIQWENYVDNNRDVQGTVIEGKKVIPFQNLLERKKDIVIIIGVLPILKGTVCLEISRQLEENNIPSNRYLIFSENNMPLLANMLFSVKKPHKEMQQLKGLKNKYCGEKAFLLGNGPSLTIEDLEKIKGKKSFGCNGILQLFEKTKWRPTGFFFGDPLFAKAHLKTKKDVWELANECDMVFTTINTWLFDWKEDRPSNLYFTFIRYDNSQNTWIEDDIERGMCNGGTSLFPILQLMLYMGFSEIILLGVDFSFYREIKNGKMIINPEVQNHPQEMDQVLNGRYDVDKILEAWICAKRYADEHNVKIINASRNGKLEVFERVDLDKVITEW